MSSDAEFQRLVQSYFDLRWSINPVEGSAAGLAEHDSRLGSYGKDDVRRYLAALKSLGGSVEAYSPSSLDDEIDHTALLGEIRIAIHEFERERPHVRNPNFWLAHFLEGLYVLLAVRDRPKEHLARAAASRLAAAPGFFATARRTLRRCPRVFVETAVQVGAACLVLIDQVAEQLAPIHEPEVVEAADAAKQALQVFVEDLPEAENGAFAIGEDAFNFRLHYQHAVLNTASELWRYGHALVEQVEAELATIGRRIDPTSPWPDLVDRLRGEHPAAAELVSAYAEAMRSAQHFVETQRLAPIPAGELEVVPTPLFLRPLIPFAAYQPPGPFSADRRGLFYVTPPTGRDADAVARVLRDHCIYEIPSTALHEGYPGHHLQLLAAQALERPVRRILGTPLTIEGWALYCEEMMGEEGFYTTPEQELFQRLALLWRAVRIVLDVGLHTRKMGFDEAVRLLIDRVHFDRSNAETEVRRYCAEPAYQLCYAVGRRELKSLRDDYRNAVGADFSLRRFHEAVFQYGSLPITLMRWGMQLDE